MREEKNEKLREMLALFFKGEKKYQLKIHLDSFYKYYITLNEYDVIKSEMNVHIPNLTVLFNEIDEALALIEEYEDYRLNYEFGGYRLITNIYDNNSLAETLEASIFIGRCFDDIEINLYIENKEIIINFYK